MFVDRYRFARHPQVIADASAPRWLALLQRPRTRARAALVQARSRLEIRQALAALADDDSRAILNDVLRYRAFGAAFSALARDEARHASLERWMTSDIASTLLPFRVESTIGETLRLWRINHAGRELELAGSKYGLFWPFASGQYQFQRGGVRIAPEPGDVVIDAGTYLGETAVRFALDAGPGGRVLALDPSTFHARVAQENVERNGLERRVRVFAAGLGQTSTVGDVTTLLPSADAAPQAADEGRRIQEGDAQVALDDLYRMAGVEKVDFIKMDIEGYEIPALEGAHDTISTHRPKLAISIYHRLTDLWAIPNLIRRKYPFYSLYLDHHALHDEETVLYARPS